MRPAKGAHQEAARVVLAERPAIWHQRIDLWVPYQDKEQAKRLGARWDRERRQWFVPEFVPPGLLERWRRPPDRPRPGRGVRLLG